MLNKTGILWFLFLFIIVLALVSIRPVPAGFMPVGEIIDAADGHMFGDSIAKCPGNGVIYRNLPQNSPGAFINGYIILDIRSMRREPLVVQKFIFYHECGHAFVGDSEYAADCYAAKHGARHDWLKETDLKAICRSFAGPATETHPGGHSRCVNVRKCFAAAKKDIAIGKTSNNISE